MSEFGDLVYDIFVCLFALGSGEKSYPKTKKVSFNFRGVVHEAKLHNLNVALALALSLSRSLARSVCIMLVRVAIAITNKL